MASRPTIGARPGRPVRPRGCTPHPRGCTPHPRGALPAAARRPGPRTIGPDEDNPTRNVRVSTESPRPGGRRRWRATRQRQAAGGCTPRGSAAPGRAYDRPRRGRFDAKRTRLGRISARRRAQEAGRGGARYARGAPATSRSPTHATGNPSITPPTNRPSSSALRNANSSHCPSERRRSRRPTYSRSSVTG